MSRNLPTLTPKHAAQLREQFLTDTERALDHAAIVPVACGYRMRIGEIRTIRQALAFSATERAWFRAPIGSSVGGSK